MNNKKSSVPKLRFPEFTDAWEQRKLGKLADFNPRSNLPDEFKYVDLESVVGTELIGYRFENKLSAPSRAQRLAQKGDIFYQTVRPYQKNNYLFEFEDENFVFSTGYAQLRPLINGRFLFSKLQEDRFVQQVLDKCTGTSYPAINSSDLSEIKVYIPDNKQEQQKIGSFFTALDRLITTHQRKLENVKKLKKSLLQKMFPKNGQEFPEIRFPEFTDAWEQRKLGEITKRVYGNDGRMDLPTLTMSASNGWLDQRERFSTNIAGEEQKNYTLLRRGQLSYNHGNSKLAKYGVVFELRNYEEALVPRVYHSFETNRETQATFLEYLFATKLPERELGKLVSSGARMDGLLNISYDDFMSIKVVIPKIQEQQKIGSFFTALDRLITTHQRKLENVKKLKKALLQQMFV
ncbi:restriction endonuclease subunit S [Pasteurella multocida]|uniref:restriction endonuclease subunit S n=2 Tax=Pasteurella multocida TaxID=747 RepID=UPI000F6DD118|nr:restriction endonuclease subunit S [Pasteurella multocida]VEJ15147.1 Type I restriction modification DNA specificity domain [Pasteurella multocida subsp. septica]